MTPMYVTEQVDSKHFLRRTAYEAKKKAKRQHPEFKYRVVKERGFLLKWWVVRSVKSA